MTSRSVTVLLPEEGQTILHIFCTAGRKDTKFHQPANVQMCVAVWCVKKQTKRQVKTLLSRILEQQLGFVVSKDSIGKIQVVFSAVWRDCFEEWKRCYKYLFNNK